MRRVMVLMCGVLLVAAACSGGSTEDSSVDGGDQATATQPTDEGVSNDSASEDQAPPATESAGGEGHSTATVTIGDVTYEASTEGALIAQCLSDLFGTMVVNLPLADGGDGGIEIIALHEGTDPVEVGVNNRVTVKIGDFDWIADPDDIRLGPDEAAVSGVESVDVDGSSLTGTATFVGRDLTTQEGWTSMTGTFEATCGEERTS